MVTQDNKKREITDNKKVEYEYNIPAEIVEGALKSQETGMRLNQYSDGSIFKCLNSVRGNSVYNFNQYAKARVRTSKAKKNMKIDFEHLKSNAFMFTGTIPYIPNSIDSTLDSMKKVRKRASSSGAFIKHIKREFGHFESMGCFESHSQGGCHCHIIFIFDDKDFSFYKYVNHHEKTVYLNNELSKKMEEWWGIGHVKVEGILSGDNGPFNYVYKELLKSENVGGALYRYQHRKPLLKNDTNKIWLFGAASIYKQKTGKNFRFFSNSKGLSVSKEEHKKEKDKMIEEIKIAKENKRRGIQLDNYISNKSDILNNSDNSDKNNSMCFQNKVRILVRYAMLSKKIARTLPSFYVCGFVSESELPAYNKIMDKYGISINVEIPECTDNKDFSNISDDELLELNKIVDSLGY